MGLFDFLNKAKGVVCPECRTKGAVKKGSQIQCPNRQCRRYAVNLPPVPHPEIGAARPLAHHGDYRPGPNAVTIQYRNFQGDDVEFVADRTTWRVFLGVISVRVAPTGARITLAKKFIRNLAVLGMVATQPEPRGVERQILTYHLRHGTTSPRFEQVRRKFPNWSV
jgi:hypothetical protein